MFTSYGTITLIEQSLHILRVTSLLEYIAVILAATKTKNQLKPWQYGRYETTEYTVPQHSLERDEDLDTTSRASSHASQDNIIATCAVIQIVALVCKFTVVVRCTHL